MPALICKPPWLVLHPATLAPEMPPPSAAFFPQAAALHVLTLAPYPVSRCHPPVDSAMCLHDALRCGSCHTACFQRFTQTACSHQHQPMYISTAMQAGPWPGNSVSCKRAATISTAQRAGRQLVFPRSCCCTAAVWLAADGGAQLPPFCAALMPRAASVPSASRHGANEKTRHSVCTAVLVRAVFHTSARNLSFSATTVCSARRAPAQQAQQEEKFTLGNKAQAGN